MYALNLVGAIRAFDDATDVSNSMFPGLSSDIDVNLFTKFYRVMCAEEPEDISDISLEEIISMWNQCSKFSRYFDADVHVLDYAEKIFNETKTILSRRRIL